MKILGSGEPNFQQSADRQKLGSLDCGCSYGLNVYVVGDVAIFS